MKLCWSRFLPIIGLIALEFSCHRGPTFQPQTEREKKFSRLVGAIESDDLSSVKELLRQGTDVNAPGENAQTPLMLAASKGNRNIVQALLAAGALVNAHTVNGETALHAAAVERDLGIVDLLITAGADINAGNKAGVTPLMASIGSPYGSPEIGLALIRAGADVNATDASGSTVLWVASQGGYLKVLEELLKRGANPNIQIRNVGFSGDTPLHMAAMGNSAEKLEILLRYGADPKIRNAKGQTPLDVANQKFPQIKQVLEKYVSG